MTNSRVDVQLINPHDQSRSKHEYDYVDALTVRLETELNIRGVSTYRNFIPRFSLHSRLIVCFHLHERLVLPRIIFQRKSQWGFQTSAYIAQALGLFLHGTVQCIPQHPDFKYDLGDKAFIVVQQPLVPYLRNKPVIVKNLANAFQEITNLQRLIQSVENSPVKVLGSVSSLPAEGWFH